MAGTISFLGVGSGQDYSAMVDALVNARRIAHIQPLQVWEADWLSKLNSINTIDSTLSSFYSTVLGMDRISEFMVRSANSSDEDVLSVSATSDAIMGTHLVQVNQLAQAETEVHRGIQNDMEFHSGVADQTASINNSGDVATGVMGSSFTITAEEGAAGNITINLEHDDGATYTAEVTDITCVDKASLDQGDYFTISSPTTDYYVWYDLDGSDSGDPSLNGYTGIKVDISSDTSATEVAVSTAAAIDFNGEFDVPVPATATLTVTNAGDGGYTTDAADSTGSSATGFTLTTTTQGTDRVRVSYGAGIMTVQILDTITTQQEISDAIAGHSLIDTVVPGDPDAAWILGGNGGADDTVDLTGGADGETKTFKFSYDGTVSQFDVLYHGTLVDLRDSIIAQSGITGVTAKIVTSGGQDHLVLVETTPDEAKSIVVDPDGDMTLDGSDGTSDFTDSSFAETVNASGSDKIFQIKYGSDPSVDITVSSGTTLEGLRDLINNTDIGVRAWILDDGGTGSGARHLVLSGENTGEDYTIELNSGGGTTLDGTNDTEDFTDVVGVFTETAAGQNSEIRVDGYPPGGWLERTTNNISDIIEGISLNLVDTGAVTVTVSTDKSAIMDKVEEFRVAFNNVRTEIQKATRYNADTGESGSLLGNYAVQIVKSRLDALISSPAPGFKDSEDAYINLQQLGFHTDTNEGSETQGLLLLDTAELSEALSSDPDIVAEVFSAYFEGLTNDNQMSFHSSLDTATAGIYDLEVNTDTEQGRFRLQGGEWGAWIDLSGSSSNYYLTGTTGPEKGIALHVKYANGTGTHSSELRLKNGVMAELSMELEDLLSSSGPLSTIDDNYNEIIENIEDRIADEERRLALYEEMLIERFSRLDAYVSQMTQLSETFTSMLSSISGTSS